MKVGTITYDDGITTTVEVFDGDVYITDKEYNLDGKRTHYTVVVTAERIDELITLLNKAKELVE